MSSVLFFLSNLFPSRRTALLSCLFCVFYISSAYRHNFRQANGLTLKPPLGQAHLFFIFAFLWVDFPLFLFFIISSDSKSQPIVSETSLLLLFLFFGQHVCVFVRAFFCNWLAEAGFSKMSSHSFPVQCVFPCGLRQAFRTTRVRVTFRLRKINLPNNRKHKT